MDSRDLAKMSKKWYESFNDNSDTVTVRLYENDDEELIDIPIKFEVCSLCNGTGHHVNPSIDDNGISNEKFCDDTNFAQECMSGLYDVRCYDCNGLRVVPKMNEALMDKSLVDKINNQICSDREYDRMCADELKNGC